MRRWIRAPRAVSCGFCQPQRVIARGDPVLVCEIVGVRRQILRCEHCAGPAPALPPLVEPVQTAGDFEHVTARREWTPYRDDD